MANDLAVTSYTKDDFLDSVAPYEALYQHIDDRFKLERELEKMSDIARNCGVKNFKTLFKGYCKKMKQSAHESYAENVTNFDGQQLELITGEWRADEFGVTKDGPFGEVWACVHPIMPVKRLVNVDSGVEKLEIAFKKGHQWRKVIFDKKQLASANSIVGALADYGVAVTSETSKHLVQYIHDVENYNYAKIPENKSVSRLGWIGEEGFSPYVEDLIFDGDISFKHYFESVKEKGSFDKWTKAVRAIRTQGNVPAKILLAASFASVLVEPCNCLPFFVHLFGGTETGKTVGLMLAASVWANPAMGKFIHTFNSTAVAQELSAGFVNSMPLILDELQIIREKKDFDQMIYQLSEGVGRARGQKTGGLQKTTTWQNCIITTGEQPISSGHSGGGAVNRIIEISCEDVKLFDDPVGLVKMVRENHGHAGKLFVEALSDPETMQIAKDLQDDFYQRIMKTQVTEKQALAASLILTADTLIDGIIFKDCNGLTVEEVSAFLSTHSEVSAHVRAYAWLNDWIAQYGSKFDEFSSSGPEVWGKYSHGKLYIIRTVFDKACHENDFNPQTFLMWLKKNDLIETRGEGKGLTKSIKINRADCQCVVLKRSDDFDEE